jgi:hypothetical protein
MFTNPVFSNPVLSKLDAAIIAVLLASGTATLVESRHRVLIEAPAETQAEIQGVSVTATHSNVVVGPTAEPTTALDGAATFEPTFAPRIDISAR